MAVDRVAALPGMRPGELPPNREPTPEGDGFPIRGLADGRDMEAARGLADTRCVGTACAGMRARTMVGLT